MLVGQAKLLAWLVLALALVMGLGESAAATALSAIPDQDRCAFLEIRLEDGWWLQLRRSEPAAYGFGALPQRVIVETGTFSLEAVYDAIIDRVVEAYPNARFTVLFSPMAPGYDGRVFALRGADALVSDLLATAYRKRDRSLDDGFQQRALHDLDPFWAKAPFLQ